MEAATVRHLLLEVPPTRTPMEASTVRDLMGLATIRDLILEGILPWSLLLRMAVALDRILGAAATKVLLEATAVDLDTAIVLSVR